MLLDLLDDRADMLAEIDAREKDRLPFAEKYAEDVRRENAHLRALVKRAATSSVVTCSDDPGCFYCDGADGRHYPGCEAAKVLGVETIEENHGEHDPATCRRCANAAEIAELNNF